MIPRPILLALRDAERAVSDAARGVGGTFARLRLATDRAERMAARLPADDRAEVERAIENLEAHYRQAVEGYRPNRAGSRWTSKTLSRASGWKPGPRDLTRIDRGSIDPRLLSQLGGSASEEALFSKSASGRMTPERWQAFAADVAARGVVNPIQVAIDASGRPAIWEGNHRLRAALAAGLRKVPVEIAYYGDSQNLGLFYDPKAKAKPNRAGRKPKTIGSGVWIHAHNGDPTKLDEEIGGGLLREIAGPHRLDVQAKVGRRDAATTAKAWMETHPPLSDHAYLEIQDDKAGELVARYAGVPRKRGAGFQWEAQARPRRAPPARKGPPAGYVPWRKEPQYLFADPTYRQAAELTARQYGIAPSALEAPAPAPLPPPPRREYKFSERGQGQLFNAAGGRARRRRKNRRNACGCGG